MWFLWEGIEESFSGSPIMELELERKWNFFLRVKRDSSAIILIL